MKIFVKQLALLLLSSLAVYTMLLGVSLAVVPPQEQVHGLDTAKAARSLFATEPKYVFLNRSGLDTAHPKVLLLGASNVLAGFRPDQLQQLMPAAEFNNLSVGGSNVTQLRQIVDLVHEVQGVEARRANTFVIGTWYGLFADDIRRWRTPDRHPGDTDIDIERYRYGFFRRTDTGPVAILPPEWLEMGVLLLHPCLVVDKLLRDATKSLRKAMAGKASSVADATGNAAIPGEKEKQRYLAFWEDYMGGAGSLSDDQFYVLAELVRRISRTGGRVIIADLPLPDWHAKRSPYHAEYRQRTRQLFKTLAMLPGVQVMQVHMDGAADDAFSDEVHPKPETTAAWAGQLAGVLNGRSGGDSLWKRGSRMADAAPAAVLSKTNSDQPKERK